MNNKLDALQDLFVFNKDMMFDALGGLRLFVESQ